MKLKATIIIKFRNAVWKIRRGLSWDDTNRSVFYNGIYSMRDFANGPTNYNEAFEQFMVTARTTVFNERLPELDCVLQYEEKEQLASLHYFLDKKYQLHIRFFSRFEVSEMSRILQEIDVYSHVEIRPDYDPVAHIKGKELRNGRLEWEVIFSTMRMREFRYRNLRAASK